MFYRTCETVFWIICMGERTGRSCWFAFCCCSTLQQLDFKNQISVWWDVAAGSAGPIALVTGYLDQGLLPHAHLHYADKTRRPSDQRGKNSDTPNKRKRYPSSQPAMTWPTPIVKSKGEPRSTLESNFFPGALSVQSLPV